MTMNKYMKLLMEKKKATQTLDSSSTGERKYLRYFNPNKYVKNDDSIYVRVLPRKNDLFFVQFKKHSFKIGASWKNAFCFYSRNSQGEIIGTECPFCDFIEENKHSLNRDTIYKLGVKNSHMFLVYNYQTNEVLKYEVNDYQITDVLVAMQAGLGLDDESSEIVDREGFDLYFKKGASGYAEVYKVEKPSVAISEIMKKTEIPDLEEEVIPPFTESVRKSIRSTFELAISVFEPTFISKTEEAEDDHEDFAYDTDENEFDPNAIDETEEFNSENEIIDSDDFDDDVEDIKNFLRSRKK
jgi:hypothetical protein